MLIISFTERRGKTSTTRVIPINTIETVELTRRFGEIIAVDSFDLLVPEGAVYGFLGPNGAGKTTTIRMLLGLIRPDCGEIHIFGNDVKAHRLNAMSKIGALVETPSFCAHLTGLENLEITRRLLGCPKNNIARSLNIVGLLDKADRIVSQYS